MTPARRWPVHPTPAPGEALSSWITRLACVYGLSFTQALAELGHPKLPVNVIDFDPPATLVRVLQAATGAPAERISSLTVAGFAPINEAARAVQSVLLPPTVPLLADAIGTHLWSAAFLMNRQCPLCRDGGGPQDGVPLLWRLPLLLTCQRHNCLLVHQPFAYRAVDGHLIPESTAAPEETRAHDRRTWSACLTGSVELPGGVVTARIWFSFVRRLLDELSSPTLSWQLPPETVSALGLVRNDTWDRLPGQMRLEAAGPSRRMRLFGAVALAIHHIETGRLRPPGNNSVLELLTPSEANVVPQLHLTYGGQNPVRRQPRVAPSKYRHVY